LLGLLSKIRLRRIHLPWHGEVEDEVGSPARLITCSVVTPDRLSKIRLWRAHLFCRQGLLHSITDQTACRQRAILGREKFH